MLPTIFQNIFCNLLRVEIVRENLECLTIWTATESEKNWSIFPDTIAIQFALKFYLETWVTKKLWNFQCWRFKITLKWLFSGRNFGQNSKILLPVYSLSNFIPMCDFLGLYDKNLDFCFFRDQNYPKTTFSGPKFCQNQKILLPMDSLSNFTPRYEFLGLCDKNLGFCFFRDQNYPKTTFSGPKFCQNQKILLPMDSLSNFTPRYEFLGLCDKNLGFCFFRDQNHPKKTFFGSKKWKFQKYDFFSRSGLKFTYRGSTGGVCNFSFPVRPLVCEKTDFL